MILGRVSMSTTTRTADAADPTTECEKDQYQYFSSETEDKIPMEEAIFAMWKHKQYQRYFGVVSLYELNIDVNPLNLVKVGETLESLGQMLANGRMRHSVTMYEDSHVGPNYAIQLI